MVLAFISPEMLPVVLGGGASAIVAAPAVLGFRHFYRIGEAKKAARIEERKAELALMRANNAKLASSWQDWLLLVVEGIQKESRADTIRNFWKFGRLSVPNAGMLELYGLRENHTARFSYVAYGHSTLSRFDGDTWNESAADAGQETLRNESDWESFARLVEVVPDEHPVHRSVDKYLRSFAANLVLNYHADDQRGRRFSAEEEREAISRNKELDALLTSLIRDKLVGWKEQSLAPKKDPVQAALELKTRTVSKAIEAPKAAPETKTEVVHVASPVVMEPKVDLNDFTEQEKSVVTAYLSASMGMPEERQKEGDKYLSRLREAVDAEVQSAGFAEEYRNQIVSISQQNRAIATQGLSHLTSKYGTSKEAELLMTLRVSNKYLLAKTDEQNSQNTLVAETTGNIAS